MDSSPKQRLIARVPVVTIALVATALVVWFIPTCRDVVIFDRDAILRGQLWRIVTGEFVHFSVSHLVCDTAVIAAAGTALERRGWLRFALLCLIAPIVIGAGVLVFEPEVRFYGGLSGLAMCFVVALGIDWLTQGGLWRWMGLLVLGIVVRKLFIESRTTDALFADLGTGVTRSRVAHVLGAGVGVLSQLYSAMHFIRMRRRQAKTESRESRRRARLRGRAQHRVST